VAADQGFARHRPDLRVGEGPGGQPARGFGGVAPAAVFGDDRVADLHAAIGVGWPFEAAIADEDLTGALQKDPVEPAAQRGVGAQALVPVGEAFGKDREALRHRRANESGEVVALLHECFEVGEFAGDEGEPWCFDHAFSLQNSL
jgi:hypothetical protein